MTESGQDRERDGDVWLPALPLDELWEGEMIGMQIEDAGVLLVKLGGGEVRAYDDRCPHAGARLSEGQLRDTTLRCSAHHWEFDVRTGEGINPRRCRLREHLVKVADGEVWVQIRRPSRT